MINRSRSRAASTEDVRITEVVDGLIVTRPAKRIEYLGPSTTEIEIETEPKIIQLGGKSKAGSVKVNKLKVIHDFIRSNGRGL